MMFVLRQTQLSAMSRAAEPSFEDEVCAHVRTEHRARVAAVPEPLLRKRVKLGIERARSHGIEMQNQLAAFVALMFVSAPNFDEHPVASKALHDETVPPTDRLDVLTKRMTHEDWEAVRTMGASASWEPRN